MKQNGAPGDTSIEHVGEKEAGKYSEAEADFQSSVGKEGAGQVAEAVMLQVFTSQCGQWRRDRGGMDQEHFEGRGGAKREWEIRPQQQSALSGTW